MLEHAHRATDPQRIIPSLSAAAVSLLLLEKPGEARAAAEEMIALARAKVDCATFEANARLFGGEEAIEAVVGPRAKRRSSERSASTVRLAGFFVRRAEAEAYSDWA